MRKRHDNWERVEDAIIEDYIRKFNSLSNVGITEMIKKDRPVGIKPIRYEGGSLYQHVRHLRNKMKGAA